MPSSTIDISNYRHINTLKLADPTFNKPGVIDLLLGAEVYADIIEIGLIKPRIKQQPIAQKTSLGWILVGSAKETAQSYKAFFLQIKNKDELEKQLKKFWEQEEVNTIQKLKPDEQKCLEIYDKTTIRHKDGTYQVDLPFKSENGPELGESKIKAYQQFLSLEKKFAKDKEYFNLYKENIEDYINTGHMIKIPTADIASDGYFLPHHGVLKESTTTKLRVVFNASAQTSNGKSLNDQMLVGPTVQSTLYTTLLRWRMCKYAVTADIEKMYRMVKINPKYYKYRYIFWRNNPSEPLDVYALTTATFGTSAAPFLAINTIHRLSKDEKENYPEAANILQKCLYVDDLVYSHHDKHELLQIQQQLILVLQKGGFHLRKWTANDPTLLSQIPTEDRELKGSLDLLHTQNIKTLGVMWHPASDNFTFNVKLPASKTKHTKRSILSEIASLFDPFG